MRYLLIYRININEPAHSGVLIKMRSQKKALESLGHEVSLINHDGLYIYQNKEKIGRAPIESKRGRYWYNFHSFFHHLKTLDITGYDCIYIRYPFSNPTFLSFCQQVKNQHPTCKLVIEMPTYPYNKEFKGLKKSYTWIDNYYRQKLRPVVDYIVHFGNETSLFDIPTIRSTNGIAVNDFAVHQSVRRENHIRLVAVGKWSYWHGLDRLLNGMRRYYKNGTGSYSIDLTIIGEGDELPSLKKSVVGDKNLEGKVCFVGIKTGQDLDAVFNEADIGVGTLGMHRKDVNYNASLKHREYCARGIPFVLSMHDAAFPETLSFVSYFASDDSPIPMEAIIQLYQREIKREEIRSYAEKNLDWIPLMEKVGSKIFENREE